jgi:hypothetical protein
MTHAMPFETPLMFRLEMVNEVTTVVLLYHVLTFNYDWVTDEFA